MCNSHSHSDSQIKNKRTLLVAFLLTLLFSLLEIITGWFIHSLALLGEGIHMLSDGFSLFLGFLAITIGMKIATKRNSFGYRRVETIAAFINGLALLIIPLFIFFEALRRMSSPQDIEGTNMLLIATIGLLINLIVAFVLFKADQGSLNIRAAALHVLADLLSSVAVIITSITIILWDITWVDPIVSMVVSIVIFLGGWKITKEAFHLLMEGTPSDVDQDQFEQDLLALDGVTSIENIKIWCIASGVNYLTLHATFNSEVDYHPLLASIQELSHSYNLHETIQLERINLKNG